MRALVEGFWGLWSFGREKRGWNGLGKALPERRESISNTIRARFDPSSPFSSPSLYTFCSFLFSFPRTKRSLNDCLRKKVSAGIAEA